MDKNIRTAWCVIPTNIIMIFIRSGETRGIGLTVIQYSSATTYLKYRRAMQRLV